MALGIPRRPDAPLHVLAMAVVLLLAAFGGAGLGFLWQSAGFEEDSSGSQAAVSAKSDSHS